MFDRFVHLGGRSDFSLGESLARVEHLCRAAVRHGQDAMALVDTMTVAGAPGFVAVAKRLGIQPILGLEVEVLPFGTDTFAGRTMRVRLLAMDQTGWQRLVALVNRGQDRVLERFPAHLTWEELLAEPAGLLYLVGGEKGELTELVLGKCVEEIETFVDGLLSAVPAEQIFLSLPAPTPEIGKRAAKGLWAVAAHYELAPVAVPEIHCAGPEDDAAWRFYRQEVVDLPNRPRMLGELQRPLHERAHVASTEAIAEWFADYPEAIENTGRVAGLCDFDLPRAARRFPRFDFSRGVDAESFIWNQVFAVAGERYGDLPSRWRERLNREFRDIEAAGLAPAIVCLARLNEEFRDRGVLRGPGAGFLTNSLIASLLGLTRVDPLRFDLPFALPEGTERQFPLLEFCVPRTQADEAVQALDDLFEGRVVSVGKWKRWTTSAALERTLELAGMDSKRARHLVRSTEWTTAKEAADLAPPNEEPDPDLLLTDVRALAWMTRRLDGRARMLRPVENEFTFCVESIEKTLPRTALPGGGVVSQWDAEALEGAGFSRIALSHSRMLDLVDEATRWVREQGNRHFDPESIPHDDPKTYKLIREGNTQGISILEPPTVKRRLRKLQPSDLTSLIRVLNTKRRSVDFGDLLMAHSCAGIKATDTSAYLAAALSDAGDDGRRRTALLGEARALGIEIRPVDLNCSTWRWAPEDNAVRVGFQAIDSFSKMAADELETVRREMTYNDLADLLRRTDPRRLRTSHIERLIRAGGLDSVGESRKELLAQLEKLDGLLRPRRRRSATEDPLQFFGHGTEWWLENQEDGGPVIAEPEAETEEWLAAEEREVLGFETAIDPLLLHEDFIERAQLRPPRDLAFRDRGQDVCLVGTIDAVEKEEDDECLADLAGCLIEASGARAQFLTSDNLAGRLVVVTGRLRREDFQWVLRAHAAETLEACVIRAERATELEIDVSRLEGKHLKRLLTLLKDFPGHTGLRLRGEPLDPPRIYQRIAGRKITVCPLLEAGLDATAGPGRWRVYCPPAEAPTEDAVEVAAR
ncbi:PHP domain-containing protein [bacterium]|nr:PHP domain-containing protein [bacterium]